MCIRFPAAMIRYERLGKNWSQEGLCDGVCAVSYLSKIEQGKAEPSPEILRGLMERLGVEWADNPRSKALVQELEEALFSLDHEAKDRLLAEVNAQRASLLHGPHMLDLLLLLRLLGEESEPEIPLSAFRDCFTPHQCALWLLGGRPAGGCARTAAQCLCMAGKRCAAVPSGAVCTGGGTADARRVACGGGGAGKGHAPCADASGQLPQRPV